jgi:hypothetical protein
MTHRSKSLYLQSLAALVVSAALCAPGAFAQGNNNPPPSGAILDLNGQTVNHGAATTESVSFTADLSSTDITFAFREDPAFISFSDVTLTNTTTGSSTNLITNGDFSSGSGENPTGWTFANVYGAYASGVVSDSCGGGLTSCWYDGSVQAYDAIDQYVATIVGDTYLLSYVYSDNGPLTTFSDLSTNGDTSDTGGNGIDILAYAQAGLPPAGNVTPEPDSIWLMSTGAVMLGAAFYYKRRNSMNDVGF